MAINKKLIHFKTEASFNQQLESGNILDTSICFIQDAKKIYTHGTFYSCQDLSDCPTLEQIEGLLEGYATIGQLHTKVNKVDGKGLSTEDYTTEEKNKLASITFGAEANVQPDWAESNSSSDAFIKNKPTIDSTLSTTSSNAVANKTVTAGINSKYTKPEGGIPKGDLAQSVQTSLGKADSALQEETDPVFRASAASSITSTDITNWNNKTSNIGTITGIKMNGESKGTSGVIDLGTVITDVSNKVDKVSGKGLSENDFTDELKAKLEGLKNYDDNSVQTAITDLKNQISALTGSDASDAIESFNEIVAFLNNIKDTSTLDGIVAGINAEIAKKADKTAITGISRSGNTFTATRANGTTFTFTQTDTTYTFEGGTNQFTVTPLDGETQTVKVIPNITNNVVYSNTLTSGNLAVFDGTSGNIKDSGFTINKSVPSNAEFTDTKVTSAANHYTPSEDTNSVLNASGASDTDVSKNSIQVVTGVKRDSKGHIVGITSGSIKSTDSKYTLPTATDSVLGGVKTGSNITNSDGTISINSTNVTSALGYTPATKDVATTSDNGLMSASDKVKLNGIESGANKYVHPSHTEKASGLYKITVDGEGHVSGATAVTKSDITGLGIPSSDTHYTSINVVGASNTATTNAAADQGSVYLNHLEQSSVKSSHKISGAGATIVTSDSNGNITINSTDKSVTSADNHYTPQTDTNAALSVDAGSSDTSATWGATNLVTGVNLSRDAKGHVTGVTVDSIKMPANPNVTYTFSGGTNQFSVTPSNGTAQTVQVTPSISNNVTYSGTLTGGQIATFDGTSGKIKASGYTIAKSVPADAVFTDTKSFTITANTEDDNIVNLEGTSGTNAVTYKATHAKKGPTNGYTSNNTIARIAGSGATGTIKVPQLTVDAYGHVTAAADEDIQIEMPTIPTLSSLSGVGTVSAVGTAPLTLSASKDGTTVSISGSVAAATTSSAGTMSATDKTKLDGIAAGAEVNQNTFAKISDGTTTITADAKQDTLNVAAGSGVALTLDSTNDKLTIGHSDTSTLSGAYGPTADVTGSEGNTIVVPQITVDGFGHVTGVTNRTYTSKNTTYSAGTGISVSNNAFSVKYGTAEGTACQGNDSRLSDTRNPKTTTLSDSNLNEITTPGFYNAGGGNGVTNKPTGVDAFGLIVFKTANGYTTQELTEGSSNAGCRWTRQYEGSSWSAWVPMPTFGETPTSGKVVITDGATGKIKSSAYSIASSVPSNAKFTDASVTAVGNHYTPSENSSVALNANASTTTDVTGSSNAVNVVTGLKRDAAGHVVGVTSAKVYSTDTKSFTITADGSGDGVVTLTGTSGSNKVTYNATHAQKGPASGYTSGNTTTALSGAGNSATIKVPQITVDKYGHVTAAADEDVTITLPSVPVTSVAGKTGAVTLAKGDVGLGNVTNESKATMFSSAALTGTPTAPTANSGTNTTQIATTAFVQTEINTKLAAADVMIFKGTIGSSGATVTALPATHNAGWSYKVITAGTYAGVNCEVGDLIVCIKDGTAAANADWTVIQTNIDGAVTGPSSSVADRVATFNGTTGKIIKDSGYTIASSVPSNAKFSDTTYSSGTGLSLSGTTFNHSNSVTAKTAYGSSATTASANGGTIVVTDVKYDAQGHITGSQDRTITLSENYKGTVTSVKLTQGTGITVSDSGTAITGSGERTVSLNTAATGTIGGVKIGKDNSSYSVTANTSSISADVTSGKYYAVEIDKNDKAFVYVPWANDTHYTTKIYAGASGTAENSAATSNPYIKIADNTTYRNQIQLKGGGSTTVSSDANGVITISSSQRGITDAVNTSSSTVSASATAVKTAYDKAVSAYDLASGKTSNTGTVTKVSTGIGLTGGDITTSGTVKANLRSEIKLTNDSAAATETSGRIYPIAADKSGYLAVNVPWTDTKVTSVGNHYAPAEDTSAAISASNGTATNITGTAGKLNVITGLKRDAKGHIVGVTSANIYSTDNNTTYSAGTGISINSSNAISLASHSADYILGGYLNIHPENSPTLIPFINNDIAHLLRRGGSAVVTYDGVTKSVDLTNVFDGSPSYWSIGPSGITTIVIELTLHKTFTWPNTIYVDFGASDWRAKSIKIEVINTNYASDVWTQKGSTTNNSSGHYAISVSHTPVGASNAGGGFNKIRFTFSSWNNSTSFRIAALGVYNYGSYGLRETFIPRDGGTTYGGLTPYANNSYTLGSSSNKWSGVYATNFYGSGANLTSLNASNISSGTVDSARLPNHTHTVTAKGSTSEVTAGGSVSSTFTGTAHKHTFTGSSVTSGAPSGTSSIYSITGVGTLPSCTLPTVSVTYNTGTLTITHNAGSFSAGSLPTRSSVTVPNSDHTHSVTAAGSLSDTTAGGSISSTFTGTKHSHTFTGSSATTGNPTY